MKLPPVLFLAFANDQDQYLLMIQRERKNIIRTLRRHHDRQVIRVVAEPSTTLEDLFDHFNHYRDQVVIFHYGGHAAGTHLLLETDELGSEKARSRGLAQLLGAQENLQLVFLNGCATKDQVSQLFEYGVKAVIATSVKIDDRMATEFAEQFYLALSSHSNIKRSFEIARSYVLDQSQTGFSLDFGLAVWGESVEADIPWGLYIRPGAEEALQWSIAHNTPANTVVRNRYDYQNVVEVNLALIEILCEPLARFHPPLDFELNKDPLDIPSIKREIIDSFPIPIGEQVRKLFTRNIDPGQRDEMEKLSLTRLKQLIACYRKTLEFVSFIVLSQLWDEMNKNPAIKISEDHIVEFNAFFNLNKENWQSFNHVKLILNVMEIFDEYRIEGYMEELTGVRIAAENDPELYAAHHFMNTVHQQILNNDLEEGKIEEYCMDGELHLATILKAFAFLVKYKLSTITNIEIIKRRNQAAKFKHHQIMLSKALTTSHAGISEVGTVFNNYSDSKSVLFLKTENDEITDYLSMSPFIIDQNVLDGELSSRIYFFAYQDEGVLHYQYLNNPGDKLLLIDANHYHQIWDEFETFRAVILGKEKVDTVANLRSGASRFMKKRQR